jgi:hypothetical protein
MRGRFGCCRRKRLRPLTAEVLGRWTGILRHLHRLRRLQRVFAYVGHHLQSYPRNLRQRLRLLGNQPGEGDRPGDQPGDQPRPAGREEQEEGRI